MTGPQPRDSRVWLPHPAGWVEWTGPNITGVQRAICPDLLSIRDLGAADGWRGHLVRGVFRLLRVVTGI